MMRNRDVALQHLLKEIRELVLVFANVAETN
jgi:hypothetical protein